MFVMKTLPPGAPMLLVLATPLVSQPAPERDPRVAWLAKNATRILSLDPSDGDFSDLEPLRAALKGVLDDGRFPYCVQDASVVPLPSPLDEQQGIRSYYLLELTGLARGVLFVAHTDAAPRGFTLLCRRLGLRLADVASSILGVALTQEWTRDEAARLHAAFGRLDAPS